jgi:capsid portal protein
MSCFSLIVPFKALASCQKFEWWVTDVNDTGNAYITGVIDTVLGITDINDPGNAYITRVIDTVLCITDFNDPGKTRIIVGLLLAEGWHHRYQWHP